jgi:hypothetical protein
MLLIALGAAVLVSAGSTHHQPAASAAKSPVAAVTTDATVATSPGGTALDAPGHDHHHGTDWTPNLTQRLRPAAAATTISVHRDVDVGTTTAGPATTATTTSGTSLTLLGVLRV